MSNRGLDLNAGLKLSHLRLLAALLESGQLGLAATKLGMAQPAASRLLAELEHLAGQPVHQRTGRGIVLTEAGTALARRALRVQLEMRDAAREMAEIRAGAQGVVHIGSVTGPALDLVLPVVRAARVAQPSTSFEVTVATSDILCRQLLAGELDFALGRLPGDNTAQQIDTQILASEPVSLVVRHGHNLAQRSARGEVLEPHDLMAFDWVMPAPDTLLRRVVVERLGALGLPPPAQRLATASFLLTLAILQQSNAIAPLSSAVALSFTAGDRAPYKVLPLDLGIVVPPFGLMTRIGTELPPAARIAAGQILEQAQRSNG